MDCFGVIMDRRQCALKVAYDGIHVHANRANKPDYEFGIVDDFIACFHLWMP
ncbi:hypothetical protein D3C80_2204560 [compost metagenome]